MSRLLWENIHLHIITSLQYLPPDVRHFAFNTVGEAEKKMVECRDLAIFNHPVGGFTLKNYGNTVTLR